MLNTVAKYCGITVSKVHRSALNRKILWKLREPEFFVLYLCFKRRYQVLHAVDFVSSFAISDDFSSR